MLSNKVNRNVTLYAFVAAFGGFVFGLDLANLSGAARYVSSLFGLSALQLGWLFTCSLVGVIVSLFFTGALCEKYGRKKILLSIALTYSLSSILSAFALNYEMLLIGRFIGGIAFASLTVSAMYIGEVAPSEQRGRFVSISQLLITLGTLLAFIVNYFLVKAIPTSSWLTEQNVWRYMLGFELIANVIWIAGIFIIPESPRWLMKKGREEEARSVLNKTRLPERAAKTMDAIKISFAEEEATTPLQQLKKLFGKPMSFVVAVAVIYAIVQGASGMNAVVLFAPMVFEQVGMSVENTFFQTIILGSVAVLGTLVAISFVEKWGRRFLTIAGLSLICIAHLSTFYGFSNARYTINAETISEIAEQKVDTTKLQSLSGKQYDSDVELKKDLATIYTKEELPLATGPIINSSIDINPFFVLFGIFIFYAAFNISIGPIMWVIFSEIFPNSVRSVALPFVALVQTIAGFIISLFFPWQLENLGAAPTFLIFAIIAGIGMVIMFFLLPETKGKSIEDLEKELVRA
ncbi:MFS transporter [Sphingorhabdus lutea]|uniref:MFS transporter n=1 Tax=Sphingorhabdus lutea TaxID=1913578 RepID=A0A1L3JA79_9SPHN|nr:MFS transporter [Sphingorhabdus lutea]APG62040.1 MFS transporter [Sphingorhabdus lutea]